MQNIPISPGWIGPILLSLPRGYKPSKLNIAFIPPLCVCEKKNGKEWSALRQTREIPNFLSGFAWAALHFQEIRNVPSFRFLLTTLSVSSGFVVSDSTVFEANGSPDE
jgi:hypothetical protein